MRILLTSVVGLSMVWACKTVDTTELAGGVDGNSDDPQAAVVPAPELNAKARKVQAGVPIVLRGQTNRGNFEMFQYVRTPHVELASQSFPMAREEDGNKFRMFQPPGGAPSDFYITRLHNVGYRQFGRPSQIQLNGTWVDAPDQQPRTNYGSVVEKYNCLKAFESILGPKDGKNNRWMIDWSDKDDWKDWDCRIDLNTTAGYGVGIQIIPLGADGKGYVGPTDTKTLKPHPALPKAPELVAGQDPRVISEFIDVFYKKKAFFWNAAISQTMEENIIKALKHVWSVNWKSRGRVEAPVAAERRACLLNARTEDWTDLQAHYYCQFTYTQRGCYAAVAIGARIKAEQELFGLYKKATAANATEKDKLLYELMLGQKLGGIVPQAYAACFSPQGRHANVLGRDPLQHQMFLYIMGLNHKIRTFNFEQESALIDKYYTLDNKDADGNDIPKEDRLRRIVDVYPLPVKAEERTLTARYHRWRELQRRGPAAAKKLADFAKALAQQQAGSDNN